MRFVSVVVPALADRDDQRVAHVEAEVEAAQLGGGDRVDVEPPSHSASSTAAALPCRRPPRSPGRSRAPCAARRARAAAIGRERSLAEHRVQHPVVARRSCRAASCEALRRLADLLEQEVRCVTAVDVARRHLRDWRSPPPRPAAGAVVRDPLHAASSPAVARRRARTPGRGSAAPPAGRRLAVDPDVARRSPRPSRTARWRR